MRNIKSICIIVSSPFTVNGFLINHLTELSKIYAVTLCVNLSAYELSPILNVSSINIVNIPIERKISIFSDINTLRLLFNLFRRNQFSSIHSITPKAGLLALVAAYFAKIQNRFHTFTGQIWVKRSGISRGFFRRIDWLISKLATSVFADSASQIDFLVHEGICEASKIALLGPGSISGVDLQRFHPNKLKRDELRQEFSVCEDSCVFLFVGRLCQDKGIFDLLEAYAKLAAEHSKTSLWIVGPDEEGIVHKLRHSSFPLINSVRWIGQTFTPESYMAAADILLLPSYREGFGSVIIEAAACGLPAIAYRIDGVVDAIVDGETGVLVDLGNVEGLHHQMQYLMLDHKARSVMGDLARVRARNEFSSAVVTQAWLNFYQSNVK